jgi:hypothetical protein
MSVGADGPERLEYDFLFTAKSPKLGFIASSVVETILHDSGLNGHVIEQSL